MRAPAASGSDAKVMVRLQAATRRYGGLTAVRSVSFEVFRGETFGLIGPDGAGKTTTLRMVLGLLAAHEGSVQTCGLDPIGGSSELWPKVGYLSQRFSLYGDLTVDEPALVVPHSRMWQRRFVLAPLADLAPELVPAGWESRVAGAVRRTGTL